MRGTVPAIGLWAVVSLAATSSSGAVVASAPQEAERPTSEAPRLHAFYFTRAAYDDGSSAWGRMRRGWGGGGARGRRCWHEDWVADLGGSWTVDCPEADEHFGRVIRRVTNLDAAERTNAVRLTDPNLGRFPFLYAVEVGRMRLSDEEVEGLRRYLRAGGFLMVDDFWGGREWDQFAWNMSRVFPDRPIEPLPMSHPIFRSYYEIDEITQVPGIGNIRRGMSTECYGCETQVLGIHDEDGRLMVAINFNSDLGDAWEWADTPAYPVEYSTFAYQMGVNIIVYAMSH